jgi:hypothetical protein
MQDLCQPEWIETDPEIFYGFWGTCFNEYRDATLHAGYDILRRWVRQRFDSNMASQEVRLFARSIMQGVWLLVLLYRACCSLYHDGGRVGFGPITSPAMPRTLCRGCGIWSYYAGRVVLYTMMEGV